MSTDPKPNAINYRKQSRILTVQFDDAVFDIPAELLRVFSPSAEVRGHGAGERQLQTGKKYVGINAVEAVGNYAVRIVFDDGHDTGIYAWDLLYSLGSQQEQYWRDYNDELKAANASRLPTIPVGHWSPKE